MESTISCNKCGDTNTNNFTANHLRHGRRECRACTSKRMKSFRGEEQTDPKRLLFNLKQRARARKQTEGALWTLADVEALIEQSNWHEMFPEGVNMDKIRMRIIPIDKTKPFVPGNAQIVPFGV